MGESYSIDPCRISLQQLQTSLESRRMIPSRQILKEKLPERFALLAKAGVSNLRDLVDALKSKDKILAFSRKTQLPEDYLIVLKREANSYFPKPIPLAKLPDVNPKTLEKLANKGIRNTKKFFEQAQQKGGLPHMARQLKIPLGEARELSWLSDLCRAYGVGPAFARLLVDLGVRSLGDFVAADPVSVVAKYEAKTGKKADFTVDDICFSIEIAKKLRPTPPQ